MTNTINFANVAQLALFQHELKGQISDGYWENSRPYEHWRIWCGAELNLADNKTRFLGRNFHAYKDNYDFSNSELLSCVGDRMLIIAHAAKALGESYFYFETQIGYSRHDFSQIVYFISEDLTYKQPSHSGEYWDRMRACFDEKTVEEVLVKMRKTEYTVKDLKADLNQMKVIVRTKSS